VFLENDAAGKTPIKVMMMDFSLVNPNDIDSFHHALSCNMISGGCIIKNF
jgi:hypothetical protein